MDGHISADAATFSNTGTITKQVMEQVIWKGTRGVYVLKSIDKNLKYFFKFILRVKSI